MRRFALGFALLFALGLAIIWPSSWTNKIRPVVGNWIKEGKAVSGGSVQNANLSTTRRLPGGRVAGASPLAAGGTAAVRNQVAADYGKLPLSFEPNAGQSNGDVRFL